VDRRSWGFGVVRMFEGGKRVGVRAKEIPSMWGDCGLHQTCRAQNRGDSQHRGLGLWGV
jgi:hypothetical protein